MTVTEERKEPLPAEPVKNGVYSVSTDNSLGYPNKGFEVDYNEMNVDRPNDLTRL